MNKLFYRRNLPHFQPAEGTFFVTTRLFGSIPKNVIRQLKLEQETRNERSRNKYLKEKYYIDDRLITDVELLSKLFEREKSNNGKRYFAAFDQYLDRRLNEPYWLQQPKIATLVEETIKFYDGQNYHLWAYCIMSNHIHLLFTLLPNAPTLKTVMQRLKSYSGKEGNKILVRNHKRFWEKESYDRWVRKGEFYRILLYIINNPVKAKIVQHWTEWERTYVHPSLLNTINANQGLKKIKSH